MKGSLYRSEASETRDATTGARVVQLTSHDSLNHHLYPLAGSTTPGMDRVVFASNRSGSWQFYAGGFPAGAIVQLTDLPGGVHGYSGHLTAGGEELLYTAAGRVRAVRLDTLAERELAAWDGASLGEVSLSADDEWLVTAMKWRGRSHLAVVRVAGGGGELILECERTIIHPQFHPEDGDWIEYSQDPAPRMWLVRRDGGSNTCLYWHGNDEFVVHETWLGSTGDLALTVWPFALKRLDLTEAFGVGQSAFGSGQSRSQPRTPNAEPPAPSMIAAFNAWHIAPDRTGARILCDTNHPDVGIQLVDAATGERRTICYPRASCGGSQWRTSRYALKEDFDRAGREEQALSWMEAKVDTVYGPQWTHPHPSWSADERWCLFDSDRSGSTQVHAVELPAE